MSLKNLSNSELERNFIFYVKTERKTMHTILLHFQEIDRRKLYLEKSRTSLFAYLVQDVGYSRQAAQRRIEGARLIREIPEVSDKIASGKIHLSHIGEFVRATQQKERDDQVRLSSGAKLALTTSIEGTTTAQTQNILSRALDLELRPREVKTVQKDESVHIGVTLSKESYELLLDCQNLCSHKLLREGKSLEMSEVTALGLGALKEKYLPRTSPDKSTLKSSAKSVFTPDTGVKVSKSLTPNTKLEIRNRYQRCQYQASKASQICGSQFLLEVDHKTSLWAGGNHDPNNLTLLCSVHNKLKYRKEAGLG